MSSFEIGLMCAAPLAIIGVGMIFLPLFWRPSRGRHRTSAKVNYRCGCTIRTLCTEHEELELIRMGW